MLVLIISLLTALFVSFFCSLTEAILLSLNPLHLETLQHQGKKYASILLDMKRNVERPIVAILILNTVANTGGALIAGGQFEKIFGHKWLLLFSAVFTLTILFGTEILPKLIGVIYHERLSPWIIRPLLFITTLLSPFIFLTELISKAVGGKKKSPAFSIKDIMTLTTLAKQKNIIEGLQEEIIVGALKLHQLKTKEIMIPEEWIVFLKTNLSFTHNLEIIRNNLHTRYPISSTEDLNGIIGYVNYKELLAWEGTLPDKEINEFIRPILIIKEETSLTDMLKLFISRHHHLAIVKNNLGNVVGLVTLEDVLEEFVGDIQDEFDQNLSTIVPIGPNKWRVGGDIDLIYFLDYFQIKEESGKEKNLSDWLTNKSKGIVFPGTNFIFADKKIIIQHARKGKVYQVQVEKL